MPTKFSVDKMMKMLVNIVGDKIQTQNGHRMNKMNIRSVLTSKICMSGFT